MSLTTAQPGAFPAQPAAPQPSLPQRVADVFFSPGKLFAGFAGAERPPWVGPVLVAALVTAIVSVAVVTMIPSERLAEFTLAQMRSAGMENTPTLADMTAQMEMTKGLRMVTGLVGAVIWPFLRAALVAAVLLVLFTYLLGGDATFRQYLAVASHAALVGVLGLVILTALQLATGRLDVAVDLSVLAPGVKGAPYAALKALSVFQLWTFAVLGIGVSAVNRRRWTGVVVAALVVVTVAFAVLGTLASTALMGNMGG